MVLETPVVVGGVYISACGQMFITMIESCMQDAVIFTDVELRSKLSLSSMMGVVCERLAEVGGKKLERDFAS